MHIDDFVELMDIRVLKIHKVKNAYNGINADMTVKQFNRRTRQWFYFTYKAWNELSETGVF